MASPASSGRPEFLAMRSATVSGVAFEVDHGTAAQELLGTGVKDGPAAERNDGGAALRLFDGLGHGPGLDLAEGVLAAAGEDLGDGPVLGHHDGVGVHEGAPQVLGELVSDRRFAHGHRSDQDDRAAVRRGRCRGGGPVGIPGRH